MKEFLSILMSARLVVFGWFGGALFFWRFFGVVCKCLFVSVVYVLLLVSKFCFNICIRSYFA